MLFHAVHITHFAVNKVLITRLLNVARLPLGPNMSASHGSNRLLYFLCREFSILVAVTLGEGASPIIKVVGVPVGSFMTNP